MACTVFCPLGNHFAWAHTNNCILSHETSRVNINEYSLSTWQDAGNGCSWEQAPAPGRLAVLLQAVQEGWNCFMLCPHWPHIFNPFHLGESTVSVFWQFATSCMERYIWYLNLDVMLFCFFYFLSNFKHIWLWQLHFTQLFTIFL